MKDPNKIVYYRADILKELKDIGISMGVVRFKKLKDLGLFKGATRRKVGVKRKGVEEIKRRVWIYFNGDKPYPES